MILSKQESKRSIRIFVSSTFKDMVAERDELMSHCWPELRRFCKERYLELIEVDLRWGISEEQDKRNETLKLCLNEIHECRPFFIGLLGERYGWIPDKEVYNPDILEEQSWLRDLKDRSVTELEIMHGVLNNPNLTGRAFFYFRDPNYIKGKGQEFISENEEAENKQKALKEKIKSCCRQHSILLKENYSNPKQLALDILEDLKLAIEKAYPLELVPDSLTRESLEHEAFAESRRKTYIGRQSYFDRLDKHVTEEGTPLVITGESGIGKSALLANWTKHWKEAHGDDFIFQHYIGGTTKSGDHWALMNRLMSEIKRWTDDPSELPKSHDEILRDFGSWLVRLRIKAEQNNVNAILVIDALNQLEDKDNAHILGWLPDYPFFGSLRLILSTTKDSMLEILDKRNWKSFEVSVLGVSERQQMVVDYLKRFSKKLDEKYLNLICSSSRAENPLFVKILLDELRITGTHEKLEERIRFYLDAESISNLLDRILDRYQKDYDKDRPNLVEETLGLIWSARRGLSEQELLELLKSDDHPQLPHAIWNPLRSALAEFLIDKNGILNFSHDFLKNAVEEKFVYNQDKQDDFRLHLADYFERIPITERSCDELPWLLKETESFERLKSCLLNLDRFVFIYIKNNIKELISLWMLLDDGSIGPTYLKLFNEYISNPETKINDKIFVGNIISIFLTDLTDFKYSELILYKVIEIVEKNEYSASRELGTSIHNYGLSLFKLNRYEEGEYFLRKSINIIIENFGKNDFRVGQALNSLSQCLSKFKPNEALNLSYQALLILENHYGKYHFELTNCLNNLALIFIEKNELVEAEEICTRIVSILENIFDLDHPNLITVLNNLSHIYQQTNRVNEAKELLIRAISITENNFGVFHEKLAYYSNNLGALYQKIGEISKAESFFKQALNIFETKYNNNKLEVTASLNNLAHLYLEENRYQEAEPLFLKSLEIKRSYLKNDNPDIALSLNNIALLYFNTDRIKQSIPMFRSSFEILVKFSRANGYSHTNLEGVLDNFTYALHSDGLSDSEIINLVKDIAPEITI
ncbi:MAG: tetratricopeptide repeat protein [Saprospiraceae bacterium]|nr:tetratricopeptide repeat protein [Saprospiraceae bacterium]